MDESSKAGKEKEVGQRSIILVNSIVVTECSIGLTVSLVVGKCPGLLQKEQERGIYASLFAVLHHSS